MTGDEYSITFKSLTSFFKPVQKKRVSSDSSDLEVSAKKSKLETCSEDDAVGTNARQAKPAEETTSTSTSETKELASDSPAEETPVERTDKQKSIETCAKDKGETDKGNGVSEEPSYSQRSTQEVKDAQVIEKESNDSLLSSQGESDNKGEPIDNTKNRTKDIGILKDVTKDDENKSNFTTPVKSESKIISTPLGMLSPLQCMAKIKSQCAKTPALHHSIGPSWFFALQGEFTKPYFTKLSQFLVGERKKAVIYPPENQVWTWTQLCSIKDVKVVILGQDPYHNPGQAHGLCFSVQKGIPPPPSLINMYKELETDIPNFKAPSHGYLVGWAQQGVLLLNACLTVRAHAPNSHKDQGWEQLTDAVIKRLSDTSSGIVFLLWGSYAHKKGSMVNKKKHHVLQATHPSPLSAHRGFMGCKHFSKCNDLLKKTGKKPIDWAHLPLV